MNASVFLKLAKYSIEQENEEKVESLWMSLYPFMNIGYIKFISLNDFKNKAMRKSIDNRPFEVIERELEKAKKEFEKGVI